VGVFFFVVPVGLEPTTL